MNYLLNFFSLYENVSFSGAYFPIQLHTCLNEDVLCVAIAVIIPLALFTIMLCIIPSSLIYYFFTVLFFNVQWVQSCLFGQWLEQ